MFVCRRFFNALSAAGCQFDLALTAPSSPDVSGWPVGSNQSITLRRLVTPQTEAAKAKSSLRSGLRHSGKLLSVNATRD